MRFPGTAIASALTIIALLVPTVTLSADPDEPAVERVFHSYWGAFTSGRHLNAAEHIAPTELKELHAILLPALLKAAESSDPESKEVADMLLDGVKPDKRSQLSPAELYALLSGLAFKVEPELADVMKQAQFTVQKITVQNGQRANVRFQMSLAGQKAEDSIELVKVEGRWYLKLAGSVAELATQLQQVLPN